MIVVLFLLLLSVLIALGPRVSLNTRFSVTELPDDLDDYLSITEAQCLDITPGAEKFIEWFDPVAKQKTPLAFVYLHGFSATRQESVPVPGAIAKQLKSNIFYTRLAGNGRSDDAMAQGSVNGWINDASEAMAIANRIGERTIIIGCSTGASLGWWTANQPEFRDQIDALVFFSPNFGVKDPRANILLYPWGAQIAEAIIGKYLESPPVNEAHRKYWACRYPTRALLPMMGMVRLCTKIKASSATVPVYILYSPYDDTVDAGKISDFIEQLETEKHVQVIDDPHAQSQHVLIGDILSPHNNQQVIDAVVEFISKLKTR
ncbi:hypothetical protein AB833_06510 [Chromatiales bacterium (ex Bugula neritina AB1)]|nr:hypothetical protein AB833_06510 [Chromatiales bacterium (ex Bugula neritina AB1)]